MDSGLRRNDGEVIGKVRCETDSLLIPLNVSNEKVGISEDANPNIAVLFG
jgi:hypothetical protein